MSLPGVTHFSSHMFVSCRDKAPSRSEMTEHFLRIWNSDDEKLHVLFPRPTTSDPMLLCVCWVYHAQASSYLRRAHGWNLWSGVWGSLPALVVVTQSNGSVWNAFKHVDLSWTSFFVTTLITLSRCKDFLTRVKELVSCAELRDN